MSRRKRETAAFSLFAFQDIITSVTGIMILVTLFLALELVNRMENSPSTKTQQIVGDIRSTVLMLQDQVRESESRVAELQDMLAAGADRIGDVAGFDKRRVSEDVVDLEELNTQLALELADIQREASSATQREQDMKNREAEHANDPETIQKLLEQVREKRQALEKLRKSKRLIFNPSEGDAKVPWIVEITAAGISAAKVGESAPPKIFPTPGTFKAWAEQRDRQREYFVLLVKPDGIQNYAAVREYLRQLRFDMGYDLLRQDQSAIDSETGAAAE